MANWSPACSPAGAAEAPAAVCAAMLRPALCQRLINQSRPHGSAAQESDVLPEGGARQKSVFGKHQESAGPAVLAPYSGADAAFKVQGCPVENLTAFTLRPFLA